MPFAALLGWMNIAQIAIPLGLGTIQTITGWIKAAHAGQMTDAELNAAIALVLDDATRRKTLAIADALGQPAPVQIQPAP